MSRLIILLVALMIGGSQACSCLFQTLDERYCQSDYAVFVKVTREDRGPSNPPQDVGNGQFLVPFPFQDVTYTLDVKKIFRNRDNRMSKGENSLTTPPNSAACGVTLKVDAYYFLAGSYRVNQAGEFEGLRLFSCGSIFIDYDDENAPSELQDFASNIICGPGIDCKGQFHGNGRTFRQNF